MEGAGIPPVQLLRPHAEGVEGFRDSTYRNNHCSLPHICPFLLRVFIGVVEGLHHLGFKLLIDLLLGPMDSVEILDPLEVADRHSSGIGEDVGDGDDVLLE